MNRSDVRRRGKTSQNRRDGRGCKSTLPFEAQKSELNRLNDVGRQVTPHARRQRSGGSDVDSRSGRDAASHLPTSRSEVLQCGSRNHDRVKEKESAPLTTLRNRQRVDFFPNK